MEASKLAMLKKGMRWGTHAPSAPRTHRPRSLSYPGRLFSQGWRAKADKMTPLTPNDVQ
jgi:hypothetical protein